MTRKEIILVKIDSLVSDFLYYDRKEDEDLPREEIEKAIAAGETSAIEITAEFHKCLKEGLK